MELKCNKYLNLKDFVLYLKFNKKNLLLLYCMKTFDKVATIATVATVFAIATFPPTKKYNRICTPIFVSTRNTNRFGNRISETSFCILIAKKYHIPFVYSWQMERGGRVFYVNDFLNKHEDVIEKVLKNKDRDFLMSDFSRRLDCPHCYLLHQNKSHREMLRNKLFGKKKIIQNDKYYIGIHLRMGDIINGNNLYKVIPIKFIIEALEKSYLINKEYMNILIIGEFETKDEKKILAEYLIEIKKLIYVQNIDIISNDYMSDFRIMLSLKRLIISVSTFSYWAAMLNPTLTELHIPIYGLTLTEILCEQWKSSNEIDVHHYYI